MKENKMAIIFTTLDDFGKSGKFVVICDKSKVTETISDYKQFTKIISEEVANIVNVK